MKNAVLARIDDQVAEHARKMSENAKIARVIAPFQVGDTIDVHLRILEGEKERNQVFSGVVISKKGMGANEAFSRVKAWKERSRCTAHSSQSSTSAAPVLYVAPSFITCATAWVRLPASANANPSRAQPRRNV